MVEIVNLNHSHSGQTYKEQQILSASPAERVVLLYNGAIKFLLIAKAAIEKGDIQERYTNNKKAIDIIIYLQSTLDMDKGAEIAQNLYRIYGYMLNRLVDVDVKNDTEAVDDVVEKLKQLNTSWIEIAKGNIQPQRVMNDTGEGKESQEMRSFDSSA